MGQKLSVCDIFWFILCLYNKQSFILGVKVCLCPCISVTFLGIWSAFVHENDGGRVKVMFYVPAPLTGCVSSLCLWWQRLRHPSCLWSQLPSANICCKLKMFPSQFFFFFN